MTTELRITLTGQELNVAAMEYLSKYRPNEAATVAAMGPTVAMSVGAPQVPGTRADHPAITIEWRRCDAMVPAGSAQ